MEVVQPVKMFETSTKHDLVIKGHVLKLKLEPCSCGVNARWVIEVKAIDTIPSFMHHMVPESDRNKTIDKVVEEWHFESPWWKKIFFRHTLEKELIKWVIKSKERFAEVNRIEAEVEKLKTII